MQLNPEILYSYYFSSSILPLDSEIESLTMPIILTLLSLFTLSNPWNFPMILMITSVKLEKAFTDF
jgi:hypothetical protein